MAPSSLMLELSISRYLAPTKFSKSGEVQPTDGNLSSREERQPSAVVVSSGKYLLFASFRSSSFPYAEYLNHTPVIPRTLY